MFVQVGIFSFNFTQFIDMYVCMFFLSYSAYFVFYLYFDVFLLLPIWRIKPDDDDDDDRSLFIHRAHKDGRLSLPRWLVTYRGGHASQY